MSFEKIRKKAWESIQSGKWEITVHADEEAQEDHVSIMGVF